MFSILPIFYNFKINKFKKFHRLKVKKTSTCLPVHVSKHFSYISPQVVWEEKCLFEFQS